MTGYLFKSNNINFKHKIIKIIVFILLGSLMSPNSEFHALPTLDLIFASVSLFELSTLLLPFT